MSTTKLTDSEMIQAYTDALGAIVTAVGWQLDAIRLYADLQALANAAEHAGHGPSAGLIDALARTVRVRLLEEKGKH